MRPVAADPANDNPPECRADCPYRQRFDGYDLQRNALRTETASMVHPWRCGWNIKPGHAGGRPLDKARTELYRLKLEKEGKV